MKLFECADGALINPLSVTLVKAIVSEGKNYVAYGFVNDYVHKVKLDSKRDTEGEMETFKKHCDGDT